MKWKFSEEQTIGVLRDMRRGRGPPIWRASTGFLKQRSRCGLPPPRINFSKLDDQPVDEKQARESPRRCGQRN